MFQFCQEGGAEFGRARFAHDAVAGVRCLL